MPDEDRNICGRAQAITVLTPIRPGWVRFSRFGFGLVRRYAIFTGTLRRLSFIHFARWLIIRDFPTGRTGPRTRLRFHYQLFESNFNGSWEEYLDAFAFVIPRRIRLTWVNSFGFPGPVPTDRFRTYVRRNQCDTDHYYSAYPEATTTTVLSAIGLQGTFERFQAESVDLDPEQFAAAYRRFVQSAQRSL